MEISFKNKLVLVTGSTKGIGFCIANHLSNLGANVIFNSRTCNKNKLKKLMIDSSKHFIADVSDFSNAENLLKQIKKKYGLLDHIVCNVGNGSSLNMKNGSFEEINMMLKRNLFPSSNILSISPNYMVKEKSIKKKHLD